MLFQFYNSAKDFLNFFQINKYIKPLKEYLLLYNSKEHRLLRRSTLHLIMYI
jgi:hypothetical protein